MLEILVFTLRLIALLVLCTGQLGKTGSLFGKGTDTKVGT